MCFSHSCNQNTKYRVYNRVQRLVFPTMQSILAQTETVRSEKIMTEIENERVTLLVQTVTAPDWTLLTDHSISR